MSDNKGYPLGCWTSLDVEGLRNCVPIHAPLLCHRDSVKHFAERKYGRSTTENSAVGHHHVSLCSCGSKHRDTFVSFLFGSWLS